MTALITFTLSNFSLTFLMLGIFVLGCSLLLQPPSSARDVVERFLSGYLLFAIGLSFFYNFLMHVFFAAMAEKFIGWANSPFQAEVGYASIGFPAVALLAWRGAFSVRLAAILGPSLFLWGAVIGHLRQIVASHKFAPGNAGVVLWKDLFLPVLGFLLLHFSYSAQKPLKTL